MNAYSLPAATTYAPAPGSDLGPTRLGANAAVVVLPGEQGPATAVLTGELDLGCVDALTATLCTALDESATGIMLDLTNVGFFDCAALQALERARQHAEQHDRRLTLERSSTAVDLVLGLAERIRD